MADDVVLNPGAGGDTIGADDIAGIKFQRVKPVIGADGSLEGGGDVHSGNPMPVSPGMTAPTTSHSTSASLAAGVSVDLDSAQLSASKTGKLVAVLMTATVPLKGELKTVLNGVESAVLATLFSRAGDSVPFELPSKEFVTQAFSATVGFDGFRLTVTNLDIAQAADVYVTFFYDEE